MHGRSSPACLHLCISLWSGTCLNLSFELILVDHLCRSQRMSTHTQVEIHGEMVTIKSANLTPEQQRYIKILKPRPTTRWQVSATTMGFHTLPHNDQLALMDHLANRGATHNPVKFSLYNHVSVVSRFCRTHLHISGRLGLGSLLWWRL